MQLTKRMGDLKNGLIMKNREIENQDYIIITQKMEIEILKKNYIECKKILLEVHDLEKKELLEQLKNQSRWRFW
jgi:hypothetical protein